MKRTLLADFGMFFHRIVLVALVTSAVTATLAENEKPTVYDVKFENIIQSVNTKESEFNDSAAMAYKFHNEREQLGRELLTIFTAQQTANWRRCVIACYLGEIRYEQSVPALVSDISLELDISHIVIRGLPEIPDHPSADALIKIGTPSIPAVIAKLSDTDGAKERDLLINVLQRIENDNEMVEVRLQKSLQAQTDDKKKIRLQAALQTVIAVGTIK